MSFQLNIKIDGARIPDTEARIIALLIYGLSYEEIATITGMEYGTIKTKVCTIMGWLEAEGIQALIRKAHAYGFDFNGYVNGKDVLHTLDRRRIAIHILRLKTEKELPMLVYKP